MLGIITPGGAYDGGDKIRLNIDFATISNFFIFSIFAVLSYNLEI